jgi:hypothetical protein
VKITNGLIAAITRFDEREVYAEAQAGNAPICLACGGGIAARLAACMRPLCNQCAHEFVREAAIFIEENIQ